MIATTKNARQVGRVHYSVYGESTVYPVADLDMNGVVDVNDVWEWDLLYTEQAVAAAYQSADIDFDGEPGTADGDLFNESYTANSGLSGKGRLSSPSVGNRLGYAGYHHDPVTRLYDVRHRWYFPEIGRWGRRDPLGYVDGIGMYDFSNANPVRYKDPLGLYSTGGSGLPSDSFLPRSRCDSPGYYYDPRSNTCVRIAHPWDCAATSTTYAHCYECCNTQPGEWQFLGPCYSACNSRFSPRDGMLPFLPSPGPGGPCFRESSGGHPACGACRSGQIDAILPGFVDPSGTITNVCCICDVSHPNVSVCGAIAACAVTRMTCLVNNRKQDTLSCRMVPCIDEQLGCLRSALVTNPACQNQILQEIRDWETKRKQLRRDCLLGRKYTNRTRAKL